MSFKEQILSKDKHAGIFSCQMEAIILQEFFTMHVGNIGEYSWIFPSFSWGIFGHVTHLDQSCTRENIWWIIIENIKNGKILREG